MIAVVGLFGMVARGGWRGEVPLRADLDTAGE